MLLGTIMDVIIISLLATQGWLMAAIPLYLVMLTLLVTIAFLALVDSLKILIFKSAHMN
jgi:H+-transporting ATPase